MSPVARLAIAAWTAALTLATIGTLVLAPLAQGVAS